MGRRPPIVPRWEWRVFGEHVEPVAARLAGLSAEKFGESDELYLLSRHADDSVKVRDGKLDVKHLERVSDEGLEQWRPVLKATFPLSAEDVATLLGALGLPMTTDEPVATLEELLDRYVRPSDDVLAVEVHKRRSHYTVEGCMAELTDLRAKGETTPTAAIESEDADRLLAVVRRLGLDSAPNVSVPRGLKALLGMESPRYAVIDIGTNSVKFHLAELGSSRRTVVDRAEVTRLGEGVEENGLLGEAAMARTLEAVAGMVDEARRNGAAAIAVVGTAALRKATNADTFVAEAKARSSVLVEVLSGEEEARLAYLAATSVVSDDAGSIDVFDTGGGSTQFTFGGRSHVDERFSVDVGAVRVTERFGLDGAVSPDVVDAALDAIGSDLAVLDGRPVPEALVGMGGAITNLAAVTHGLERYDPEVVHGSELDRGEIERQIELYGTRTAEQRRAIPGLQPGREHVILAGACVVQTVLAKLGRQSLTVSDRGLRHGVLLERFGG
jgi:exopolyphosphatase/guanosine-5'-triphosphate,3'-diphosphate pyrophosphatase